MHELENKDGLSRLVFPKDGAVPEDGVVTITVHEAGFHRAMLNLRSRIGAARRYLWCSCHGARCRSVTAGPIVTFSFDDFPKSALTKWCVIIERYGGRATYYVAMGLMDQENNLGEQFHAADWFFPD